MPKRKMIQSNLLKNSISAYFSAIEIHNKPNIKYRYETTTLLMANAWELALKAFVKKYVRNKSIFTKDGHTISLDKALVYATEFINNQKKNSFTAINLNITEIEKYRNNIVHFYCDEMEPYIFMLLARSALNYVEFIKSYFSKDIMADEGLFILPLGFKLPFNPADFLSHKVAKYAASTEAKLFIKDIVEVIKDLKDQNIEDSIVLGFDIYLENVKKDNNSDILAAISSIDKADAVFHKSTNIRVTNDESAQVFNINDEELRRIYRYNYREFVDWCRINIKQFKQNQNFYSIKRKIEQDKRCMYLRRLDMKNVKSPAQKFYSETALEQIKIEYEK